MMDPTKYAHTIREPPKQKHKLKQQIERELTGKWTAQTVETMKKKRIEQMRINKSPYLLCIDSW